MDQVNCRAQCTCISNETNALYSIFRVFRILPFYTEIAEIYKNVGLADQVDESLDINSWGWSARLSSTLNVNLKKEIKSFGFFFK